MATTWAELDWYDTPLYYDIVFEEDTRLEGAFLEVMALRHGRPRGRRVLEPACGSGRLLEEMARRGWKVTGFDLSEPMLEFSRERLTRAGLPGRVVAGDMAAFSVRGKFDLAHCLVSTFKYLLDERSARSHLEHVAAALAPGGIYVLGLHLSDYADLSRSRERWTGSRGRTSVVCNIQGWPADARTRTERVRSRLKVVERGRERRCETSWTFRTYDAAQLKRLLRSVPALELRAVHDFGYDPDETRELDDEQLDCVLVLKKRP